MLKTACNKNTNEKSKFICFKAIQFEQMIIIDGFKHLKCKCRRLHA